MDEHALEESPLKRGRGRPPGVELDATLTFRLRSRDKRRLEAEAQRREVDVSDVVRDLVEKEFASDGK